jgi:2-(1,2-epoxy-1,2-dihydrophenyl)acetyl-CoA isomerase
VTAPIRRELGDDGVARLTLNRPLRLNAFDGALAEAFADAAVEATSRDDVRAILIDGAGPAFCAGGDVVAMATSTSSGVELTRLARTINRGLLALLEAPIPVVAAAHGTTAGGGLGLLLASDYAVVGADSRIGARYANVGLTPDLSVTALLTGAVGERRALQLLLSDTMLTACQALDWGLVAEVVGDESMAPEEIAEAVRARADEIARGWAAGPRFALGQAKRLIRSRLGRSLADQLDEEARTIGAAFDTPDAQARIRAFASRSAKRSE